jgi:hypothetical protein
VTPISAQPNILHLPHDETEFESGRSPGAVRVCGGGPTAVVEDGGTGQDGGATASSGGRLMRAVRWWASSTAGGRRAGLVGWHEDRARGRVKRKNTV